MTAPVVQVKDGKLRGFVTRNIDGGAYLAFRGIPYAEPPIGHLRFKDPKRPKPWSYIRDVGDFSPKAVQNSLFTGINSGDEDCLYLNVATNSLIGKKPVMVWIHGGGFVMGGPHGDLYGPDYLIKHDIVFVGITYRLGCLGFLNLDMPEASGNQGLKDQVAALKWIRENILVFGGDPENITIFGESAGSACVHLLTVTPLAKGLFHKAIIQSGVCINPWAFDENPLDVALRLTAHMGKKTRDPKEAWKFLMSASTKDLMKGQGAMNTGNMAYDFMLNFVPSVDRKSSSEPFMPEPPAVLSKQGINVPLIMGYTSDEGIICAMGPTIDDVLIDANTNFRNVLARDLKFWPTEKIEKVADSAVRKYYFGEGPTNFRNKKKEWSKFKGDILVTNGTQEIADLQMEKSTPTYLYRFSYRATYPIFRSIVKCNLEGASHGDELGALFHGSSLLRNTTYQKGTRDRLTMERMTRMWTNFAKTGNPTPELNEEIQSKWEPLTVGKKNCLDINDDLILCTNPDQDSWDFWKNIFNNLA